jgi:hypothetical protein
LTASWNDVEQVHGDLGARQHPAHRALIDRAHVHGHDLDVVAPGRAGLPHPVRGVIGGTALGLPQQPLIPGQVEEAAMPAIGQHQILAAVFIDLPAGPPTAVLADPQVRHQAHRPGQRPIGLTGERLMGHRPRHALPPGGPGDRAAPLGGLGAGQLPQPRRQPAPRRDPRQGPGERAAPALAVAALPPSLQPARRHLVQAPAQVTRAGQRVLVHGAGDRPATRAGRRPGVIGDSPHRDRAVGLRLGLDHLQAVHAGQC